MVEYIPSILRDTDPPKKPQKIVFAIGTEHRPNEFGMWAGPTPDAADMLETVGTSDKDVIVRFNADGTNDIIWRWKTDRWVSEGGA